MATRYIDKIEIVYARTWYEHGQESQQPEYFKTLELAKTHSLMSGLIWQETFGQWFAARDPFRGYIIRECKVVTGQDTEEYDPIKEMLLNNGITTN